MHKDLSSLKREYDSIYVPPEVDLVIEKAIQRSRQSKQIGYFLKPLVALASVLVLLILFVNISPVFSHYLSGFPGMESILPLVTLNSRNSSGNGQVHGLSVTDQGITLTVLGASYDGKSLSLNYELKSNGYSGQLKVMELMLRDSEGSTISFDSSSGILGNRGWTEIELKSTFIPEKMVLEISRLFHVDGMHEYPIQGDWVIPLDLDTKRAPRHFVINKNAEVDGFRFSLDYLDIVSDSLDNLPYTAEFTLTIAGDNAMELSHFSNPRLEDDKGNVYPAGTCTGYFTEEEYRLLFGSDHLPNVNKLFLTADGIYSKLTDYFLIFDVDNRQVLDSHGVQVEYLRAHEQTADMLYWFKINSADSDAVPIGFMAEARDLSGEEYEVRTIVGEDHGEFGLLLDKANLPDVLKLGIDGYKAINKPFKIQLS